MGGKGWHANVHPAGETAETVGFTGVVRTSTGSAYRVRRERTGAQRQLHLSADDNYI